MTGKLPQRCRTLVYEGFQLQMSLLAQLFQLLALRDVVNGEQDERFAAVGVFNRPSIENHRSGAQDRKVMRNLKVLHRRVVCSNLLEQCPKLRDIPLFISQPMKELSLSFLARDPKVRTEGWVSINHSQIETEDEKRHWDGINNRLRKFLGSLETLTLSLHQADVSQHQHSAINFVVYGPVWTNLQGIPTLLLVLHFQFFRSQRLDDLRYQIL